MLDGSVIEVPDGTLGFDCNQHLSAAQAAELRRRSYGFVNRYVPRRKPNPNDISGSEAVGIIGAGLGLMIVQHVQMPGWIPTGNMGTQYGEFGAASAREVGYSLGGNLWCDLEGVKAHTDPRDVSAFCRNWYHAVGEAGYTPGLYVGDSPGLNAVELYRLPFEHYWAAYNLNRDQYPAVRGAQMQQHTQVEVAGIVLDPDTVHRDKKGGLPLMATNGQWTPPRKPQ